MSDPLISILLPVKNAANYLHSCLDSILDQSEQNWELIAIEDHSDDHSWDILTHYAQLDQRIKVFKNEGQGIIAGLRKAYKNSQGHLISRMDADDLMSPQKLEALKTLLIKRGPGHVVTAFVEYFSDGILGEGYLKYQNWLNGLTANASNFSDIYKECVIPSPCWMVYREDLDQCNAFNSNLYPEDYDLSFRFYKNKLLVLSVPKVLHLWRDHPTRTSRNDPNYSDVHFFDLKVKYFLELDYDQKQTLVLWGAGKKGKHLAKILIQKNIPFRWITDNAKKIGKDIYGILLESSAILEQQHTFQIIIAIAASDAELQIQQTLNTYQLIKNKDFFSFC